MCIRNGPFRRDVAMSVQSWCASCVLVFSLVCVLVTSQRTPCLLRGKLKYCECQTTVGQGPTDAFCQRVPSRLDLRHEVVTLSQVHLDHFYLMNSDLQFLHGDIFHGARIERLEISSTPLTALAENDEQAFSGLEGSLKDLVLRYSKLTNEADWSRLGDLNELRSLDLSFNPLREVQDDTFSGLPPGIRELYLKGCGIQDVSLKAFASMQKLVVLDLSENLIIQLTRSMFPQPANELRFLYLSYNQIKELPPGTFHSMPNLKTVYADHNSLAHLPEHVWQDVWMNSPRTVDLLGNDIVCDHLLCWLTFWDAAFLRGSCSDPDSLRGRRFLTLYPWEVHCNETLYHGNLSLPFKPHF